MTQIIRTKCWHILIVFSIGLMAASAFAQSLEVVNLKHRTAQELIPALQPLVVQGGSLSGQDYTLFVRTTASNFAELRRVIAQLDRAPRTLLVSVRNASRQELMRKGGGVSGELSTDGARVDVHGSAGNARESNEGVASVAVLEGSAALINDGASVPIVTAIAGGGGRRPWIAAQTEYRNFGNGFVVTPRVNGEVVVLDISQRAEAMRNGTIETQQLETQVSGRVGEWMALGDVRSTANVSRSGVGSREYSTRRDERTVWVKVELQ